MLKRFTIGQLKQFKFNLTILNKHIYTHVYRSRLKSHHWDYRGVQPSRQPDQLVQPNPKFVDSQTFVGWVELKFLKKNFNYTGCGFNY